VQDGYAPASAVALNTRVECNLTAAILSVSVSGFTCMIKDETTSAYVYLTMPASTANSGKNVDDPGSFNNSTWYYLYAVCASGVGRVEITATAPLDGLLVLDSTNTRRYLGCFYVDSGGNIPYLVKSGREYRWPQSDSYFFGSQYGHTDYASTSPISHDISPWKPPTAQFLDVLIHQLAPATAYQLTITANSLVQYAQGLSSAFLVLPHRFWVAGTNQLISQVTAIASNIGGAYSALGFVE
jgi:hypothetical protein